MSRNYFKQKVLLTFGYNGSNYHGLQIQKTDPDTIEAKVFQALKESQLIGEGNENDLSKSGWSRGARTDKGVHALCNSIAVKLCINKEFFKDGTEQVEEIVSKQRDKEKVDYQKVMNVINSNLPNDIRLHSIKLVTQGFDVRKNARYRYYEYIAPVKIYSEDKKAEEIIERVQNLAKKFEGTHNFHNYSRGMKYTDPQSMRYILSIKVEQFNYKEQEFFKFLIHGQSFIYHQIRKMMGIIIQIFSEGLPDSFIDNTFFKNQLRICLAPAEGLFLNRISFDGYNTKMDIPQLLQIEEDDQQKIDKFRPQIIDYICEQEITKQVFTNWIKILKDKNFNVEEEEDNNNNRDNDE